jgi:hypothetical protein
MTFTESTPEEADELVREAIVEFGAEINLETYAALRTAVLQYGRACARRERAVIEAELADTRTKVARLLPADETDGSFAIAFADDESERSETA